MNTEQAVLLLKYHIAGNFRVHFSRIAESIACRDF